MLTYFKICRVAKEVNAGIYFIYYSLGSLCQDMALKMLLYFLESWEK